MAQQSIIGFSTELETVSLVCSLPRPPSGVAHLVLVRRRLRQCDLKFIIPHHINTKLDTSLM